MDINNYVHGFKTKYEQGFTPEEMNEVLEHFKDEISMDAFNDAMMGNTCPVVEGQMLVYKHDLITGIRCGIENRTPNVWEWD